MTDKKQKKGAKKKPYAESAIHLQIYPKGKHIKACGGKEKAKQIALQAIENFKPNTNE